MGFSFLVKTWIFVSSTVAAAAKVSWSPHFFFYEIRISKFGVVLIGRDIRLVNFTVRQEFSNNVNS